MVNYSLMVDEFCHSIVHKWRPHGVHHSLAIESEEGWLLRHMSPTRVLPSLLWFRWSWIVLHIAVLLFADDEARNRWNPKSGPAIFPYVVPFFFQNGISLLVQKAFEENCVGDFTTEIMTLLYSIHLYFSGLLGSSTLVLLTILVIGNQNQNHLKFLFERVKNCIILSFLRSI